MSIPKLRVARMTDNTEAPKPLYIDAFALDVLAEFSEHDGHRVVFKNAAWE